jgi:glycosyltransferase involved in cell wall biosynthesis
LPFDRLAWYTRQATIGMSLEQNLGLSYYYSLPNKLFDYLHAGLPVIASDLPEIKKIVEDVSFGLVIDRFDPEFLSRQILFMINSPALLDQWRQNALDAASRYTWEFEEEALKSYFPIIE